MSITSEIGRNPFQNSSKREEIQSGKLKNHTFSLRVPSLGTILKVSIFAVSIFLILSSLQGANAQTCNSGDSLRVTGPNQNPLIQCQGDVCTYGLPNGTKLEVHPNVIKEISSSGYVMRMCPEASPSMFTTDIDQYMNQVNYTQTSDMATRYTNWKNAGYTQFGVSDTATFINWGNILRRQFSVSDGCFARYCSEYGDIKVYASFIGSYDLIVFGLQPLIRKFLFIGFFPGSCTA